MGERHEMPADSRLFRELLGQFEGTGAAASLFPGGCLGDCPIALMSELFAEEVVFERVVDTLGDFEVREWVVRSIDRYARSGLAENAPAVAMLGLLLIYAEMWDVGESGNVSAVIATVVAACCALGCGTLEVAAQELAAIASQSSDESLSVLCDLGATVCILGLANMRLRGTLDRISMLDAVAERRGGDLVGAVDWILPGVSVQQWTAALEAAIGTRRDFSSQLSILSEIVGEDIAKRWP